MGARSLCCTAWETMRRATRTSDEGICVGFQDVFKSSQVEGCWRVARGYAGYILNGTKVGDIAQAVVVDGLPPSTSIFVRFGSLFLMMTLSVMCCIPSHAPYQDQLFFLDVSYITSTKLKVSFVAWWWTKSTHTSIMGKSYATHLKTSNDHRWA